MIRDAKATGLANLPFDDIVNNDVWMQLCFCANDLLAWSQQIGCTGQLRRATPKTIRHRLLHVAARITPTSRRLRLDRHWPWTVALLDAITRVRTAFASLSVTGQPPLTQPYERSGLVTSVIAAILVTNGADAPPPHFNRPNASSDWRSLCRTHRCVASHIVALRPFTLQRPENYKEEEIYE